MPNQTRTLTHEEWQTIRVALEGRVHKCIMQENIVSRSGIDTAADEKYWINEGAKAADLYHKLRIAPAPETPQTP